MNRMYLSLKKYLPYFPAHKTHFFSRKSDLIRPASYVPRVSIISKLVHLLYNIFIVR